MVGGLLLFCNGSDLRDAAKKDNAGLAWTKNTESTLTGTKTIATRFREAPNDSERQLSDSLTVDSKTSDSETFDSETKVSNTTAQSGLMENSNANALDDAQKTPLQIIDTYMTAWSGSNRGEIQKLWDQISQCPACLQRIQELLMNQSVPKGMLLELTYQIIELGDESMLPVFDYLLQPSVDLNTRIIIILIFIIIIIIIIRL